jgi:guanosine-3',5'-bis(diphosphate) 3'-pyrophosphohydrolase
MTDDFAVLQNAVSFAARAHRSQSRKDGRTPYAAHPFRVCLALRHLFGVADPRILAAAVLHDTIEDTTTDHDDLTKEFGRDIADWVWALSKDKRKPEPRREKEYRLQIERAPWPVKLIKLADLYDNLSDAAPPQREKTIAKARAMLPAVLKNLPPRYRPLVKIVQSRIPLP